MKLLNDIEVKEVVGGVVGPGQSGSPMDQPETPDWMQNPPAPTLP